MTVVSSTTSNVLNYTSAGTAYARASTITDPLIAAASSPADSANATNVTLSDQALALLAAQSTTKDFATVTADARTALDALYKDAKVTVPLAGGKPTIDLSALDRRTLFAIASNSQGK